MSAISLSFQLCLFRTPNRETVVSLGFDLWDKIENPSGDRGGENGLILIDSQNAFYETPISALEASTLPISVLLADMIDTKLLSATDRCFSPSDS